MGMRSYENGLEGERLAERYLEQHGYQIVEKNYHSQQGEIDIIAREGNYLVFVEVKNYSFRCLGTPLSAVRKSKRHSIIHAANSYMYKRHIKDTNCRFDVLTIYRRMDGSSAVELYKNAFGVN